MKAVRAVTAKTRDAFLDTRTNANSFTFTEPVNLVIAAPIFTEKVKIKLKLEVWKKSCQRSKLKLFYLKEAL